MDDQPEVLPELSGATARMAELLLAESDLQTALSMLSSLAKDVVGGSDGAGVTLIEDGRSVAAAHTDVAIAKADQIQFSFNEGPCLAACKRRIPLRVHHAREDTRWPRWATQLSELGMASFLAAPLMVEDEVVGAVETYSSEAGRYGAPDEEIIGIFSRRAAVLVANVRAYEDARHLCNQLTEALDTRQMIGQAMGILMEREGIDVEASFARLKKMSQNTNVKLRDVARNIVRSVGQ